MGSVADRIARKVATRIRSNVIDLSAFRASRERAVEAGQLWYTRLLPPPLPDIGHHVVVTTPYVVLDGTERRFLDYIGREVARMAAAGGRKAVDAEALLMVGPTANHWNEYIFLAYVNHQPAAIFLAGVPDIRESLPQA